MFTRAAALAITLTALVACQKDGGDLAKKLEELEKRAVAIDARLAKLEGFLKPYLEQPPAPPEPDPRAVYAVPVDGAPYKGPEVAAVTIVEAFEFA